MQQPTSSPRSSARRPTWSSPTQPQRQPQTQQQTQPQLPVTARTHRRPSWEERKKPSDLPATVGRSTPVTPGAPPPPPVVRLPADSPRAPQPHLLRYAPDLSSPPLVQQTADPPIGLSTTLLRHNADAPRGSPRWSSPPLIRYTSDSPNAPPPSVAQPTQGSPGAPSPPLVQHFADTPAGAPPPSADQPSPARQHMPDAPGSARLETPGVPVAGSAGALATSQPMAAPPSQALKPPSVIAASSRLAKGKSPSSLQVPAKAGFGREAGAYSPSSCGSPGEKLRQALSPRADDVQAERKANEEEEAQLHAELESKREAEGIARAQVELEAKRRAKEENMQAELEAQRRAEEMTRLAAQLEAKRRAEEAELEAKRKAKEMARLQAELEAKRRAEERVQFELEANRKAQAELEAKCSADEARVQSELQAKRKAQVELEAKRKAEEERLGTELQAKRTVEENSRQKAELQEQCMIEERQVAVYLHAICKDEEAQVKAELAGARKAEGVAQAQPKAEAKHEVEEEQSQAELEAQGKTEQKARLESEWEATCRAKEALVQAELESKRKDEMARVQADVEARAQAEEVMHRTAEKAGRLQEQLSLNCQDVQVEPLARPRVNERVEAEDKLCKRASVSRRLQDMTSTDQRTSAVRLDAASLVQPSSVHRTESPSIVTPRMDRIKRMAEEAKRHAAEVHLETQARRQSLEAEARLHAKAFRQVGGSETISAPSMSPKSSPPASARATQRAQYCALVADASVTSSKEKDESMASATTGTEAGSPTSPSPNSEHSLAASAEFLLPQSALVAVPSGQSLITLPSGLNSKQGGQTPIGMSFKQGELVGSPSKLELEALGPAAFTEHHVICTARSHDYQGKSAALNILAPDSQFLWVNRSDADIGREIDALLSNINELSRECNELFYASLEANFEKDVDYATMSPAQLHTVTQCLVNHLGSRDTHVLERLRLMYRSAFKQRFGQEGINADEFRDYISVVLALVSHELEARERRILTSIETEDYAAGVQKTRSTLELIHSTHMLHYWSSSEFLATEGAVQEEEDLHAQPLQMMLTSLRERLSSAVGDIATESASKAPSRSSTGSKMSGQISPKTQEAREVAKESERKAEFAFEATLKRAWEVIDKDQHFELVSIEDRLREEEARLSVSYRRQRAELRNSSRQEVARLLLPCSPANRPAEAHREVFSSAASESEA